MSRPNKERAGTEWAKYLPLAVSFAVMAFLTIPLLFVLLTSFNPSVEPVFPPKSFSLKWYMNIPNRPAVWDGFKFSVTLAALTTVIGLAIGMLCSLALVRYRFPGRNFINTALLSPLVVPQVVLGISLLFLLTCLGSFNSFRNLIIAHVILTLPYIVRVLSANLYRFDISIEEAAMSLGAGPAKTLWYVTLPLIKPGLFAAGLFSFIVSFDNFSMTMFLVTTRETLPVAIYSYIKTQDDPTIAAISTLLLLLTVAVLIFTERYIGLKGLLRQ